MHDVVFNGIVIWHLVLIAILSVYALRTDRVVARALAVDTLAIVFVATLVVVAIHREEAGYLDVALVLAVLGFVQTVGVTGLVATRRDPK